eukprot:TRINITY_DN3355_c3_g1_i1.p1 TRINITY_DN3355_c3_g1~~TRINITY_DN3355_c3_g1_i1.p1  ORF type:complete len:203 (+),score=33.98 TRINITY_DN3355_c3_g1_i1:59-667(+)
METSVAVRFKDRVIMAAAGITNLYFMKFDENADKLTPLDDSKLVATVGETADRESLMDFIKLSLKSTQLARDKPFSSTEMANYIRYQLAEALRSRRGLYKCDLLMGSYDTPLCDEDDTEPGTTLYWYDHLASMSKVDYGAHGYGATFIRAVLDKDYREDMNEEESLALVKRCLNVVNNVLTLKQGNFCVKIVDKDGIRKVEI